MRNSRPQRTSTMRKPHVPRGFSSALPYERGILCRVPTAKVYLSRGGVVWIECSVSNEDLDGVVNGRCAPHGWVTGLVGRREGAKVAKPTFVTTVQDLRNYVRGRVDIGCTMTVGRQTACSVCTMWPGTVLSSEITARPRSKCRTPARSPVQWPASSGAPQQWPPWTAPGSSWPA